MKITEPGFFYLLDEFLNFNGLHLFRCFSSLFKPMVLDYQ